MRTLGLTSPHMRGEDVKHLQGELTKLGFHVAPDGEYGPATDAAAQACGFRLGLEVHHPTVTPGVRRIFQHPELRDPAELVRAHHRHQAHPSGPTGLAAVASIAATYIGVHESPAGTNSGHPFPTGWEGNFGLDHAQWCGCFSGSMVLRAGGHVTPRVVYCPYIVGDAHSHTGGFEEWQSDHRNAGVGWLVLYCWDGTGTAEHVGVVESIHTDHLVAIEGNTGGTEPGWGGMVARVSRTFDFVLGYAKPRIAA